MKISYEAHTDARHDTDIGTRFGQMCLCQALGHAAIKKITVDASFKISNETHTDTLTPVIFFRK